MEIKELNKIYSGAEDKQHTYDFILPENFNGTVLLFMHGFMGFKDWGCWDLMMDRFVKQGYGFCRFNITHNGTTPDRPQDFCDLESFGKDTYFKQLTDLRKMIDLARSKINESDKLVLIGHSRGGGVVILGSNNEKVDAVISLAGISSIGKRFPKDELLEQWRVAGVRYAHNSRTSQDLPQYFVQYEDYMNHQDELNIEAICKQLKKPVLLIHGDKDVSISIEEGNDLAKWCRTDVSIISGADHVFGAKHPWASVKMPVEFNQACLKMEEFLLSL